MKRLNRWHSLVAVISLFACVIWHVPVRAAVAPELASLGRIDEGLLAAGRLDVDNESNLYVADCRQEKVLKYDKFGRLVRIYSGFPVYSQGLAVTPDGSKLYVAGKTVVTIVNGNDGTVLGRLKSTPAATGEGEFGYANEIDLDADGYIYVADMGAMQVKVYTPAGVLWTQFGGIGTTGRGKFRSMWAMTVDSTAREVYVADNMSAVSGRVTYYPQIQVFDLNGTYKRSMTQSAFASGTLGVSPLIMFAGMTFDNAGRGYFLDSMQNNIRIHSLPVTVLPPYGVEGYGLGQLSDPYDIIFDPLTNRFFVSTDTGRIEIFGLGGATNPEIPVSNVAPNKPVLIGPGGDSEVAINPPLLTFGNASDDDKDLLTYDISVRLDGQIFTEQLNLPEGTEATTSVQVTSALQENARYSWTAKAFDGQVSSAWAEEETFFVNAVQEAPEAPLLLTPASAGVLSGEDLFWWESSADPDPFDTVTYVMQVASDAGFADPVIAASVGSATSTVLRELPGYADLVDGRSYVWRVTAVDNHGLETASTEVRSFVYDTTVLRVTSNMPGARVYLGGNLAYAGRYVGDAPVELRDLAPTSLSVVVERAGFEPWISQAVITDRGNVELYASLVPAITPADLKARPLTVGSSKLVRGGDVTPFAVDFDSDGMIDLVIGEASGVLTLYRGQASDEPPAFGTGEALMITVPAGSAPVVADWNNDGKKDVLVGTAAGTVQYYPNQGTEEAPLFSASSYLTVAGVPIAVGSAAVPVVFDWDADGDKDLLVGSGGGAVNFFRNIGSDASPELANAEMLLPPSAGNAAPFVVDWNADGIKDILVASDQRLNLYLGQADASFVGSGVLALADDRDGRSAKASHYVGDRLRVFAYDADGKKGKDLIVGNASGEVWLVRSNGMELVPTFSIALGQKLEQVRAAVPAESVLILQGIAEIESSLVSGNLVEAKVRCGLLLEQVVGSVAIETPLAELALLLN